MYLEISFLLMKGPRQSEADGEVGVVKKPVQIWTPKEA